MGKRKRRVLFTEMSIIRSPEFQLNMRMVYTVPPTGVQGLIYACHEFLKGTWKKIPKAGDANIFSEK